MPNPKDRHASDPDLSTIPTLELWEEIASRFSGSKDQMAAVFAYTDIEDGGRAFYRLLFEGSYITAYGLSTALRDSVQQALEHNTLLAQNAREDEEENDD